MHISTHSKRMQSDCKQRSAPHTYIHIHRDDLHAHTLCRVYIVQRNVNLRINKKNKTFRAPPIGNKTKHHNTTLESNILSLNIYLAIYMYILYTYICIKLKFFFIFRGSIGKYFDKWEAFCRALSLGILFFLFLFFSSKNFVLFSNGKIPTANGPIKILRPKGKTSFLSVTSSHLFGSFCLMRSVADRRSFVRSYIDRVFVLFTPNHSKCKL